MKNMNIALVMAGMILLSGGAQASGKVVRATEMGATMWSDISRGKLNDVTVEFRQGDELPVSFEAQGDLIETRQSSVSYIGIKKNFLASTQSKHYRNQLRRNHVQKTE